ALLVPAQIVESVAEQQCADEITQLRTVRLLPDLPRSDRVALRALQLILRQRIDAAAHELGEQAVAGFIAALRRCADRAHERAAAPARDRIGGDVVGERASAA